MTPKIIKNQDLRHLNTFGVAAHAAYFADIQKEEQLFALFKEDVFRSFDLPSLSGSRLVLGGGSNMLFTKDYPGLVIKINIPGIRHQVQGDEVRVTAGGGVIWNDLVWYCVERGFWGIENLALIPGTVGASPVQNIGAYGVELMEVFESCRVFDTVSHSYHILTNNDCGFSYRDSIFKHEARGRFIITEVTLKLSLQKNPKTGYGAIRDELERRGINTPGIRDMAEVVSAIRVAKLPDPSTIGNAGSFFKNPIISASMFEQLRREHPDMVHYPMKDGRIKLAAGWLIDQAGWRGKREGDSGTWKNQALVLVNHGRASGDQIYEFSEAIITDIQEKYGVILEREVTVI